MLSGLDLGKKKKLDTIVSPNICSKTKNKKEVKFFKIHDDNLQIVNHAIVQEKK